MDSKPSATPPSRPNGAGHEQTDAQAGWIFAILFFLGIGGIALHFVVLGALNTFQRQAAPSDRLSAVTQARQAATAWTNRFPPLQVNPPNDWRAFREREEAQLNTYGWIDRTAGVVRIPIARAIDLLLEAGLPVRQGANQASVGASSWDLQQQRAGKDGKPP
jgi:hypothetical protein